MNHLTLQLGDLRILAQTDLPPEQLGFEESWWPFVSAGTPDIRVRGRYGALAELSELSGLPEDEVFASQGCWRALRRGERRIFLVETSVPERPRLGFAVFDPAYSVGEVVFGAGPPGDDPSELLPHPLSFPFLHLMTTAHLAMGKGVVVHASGVDDHGDGYLFPASPGQGKTTLARLFHGKAEVLCDERVILRERGGRPWIYGTPWHGDLTQVSPAGAPLRKLFFPRHAPADAARRLTPSEAAAQLLGHCFLPYWEAEAMELVIGFCARVAEAVPCFDLGFLPGEGVIELIRCVE